MVITGAGVSPGPMSKIRVWCCFFVPSMWRITSTCTGHIRPKTSVKGLRRFRPATDPRFGAYAPDRSETCRADLCFPRYGVIRLKMVSSIRMSFNAKLLYDGPDMQRSSRDYRQKGGDKPLEPRLRQWTHG